MLSELLCQATGAHKPSEQAAKIQLKLGSCWQRLDSQSQPIDFQSDVETEFHWPPSSVSEERGLF